MKSRSRSDGMDHDLKWDVLWMARANLVNSIRRIRRNRATGRGHSYSTESARWDRDRAVRILTACGCDATSEAKAALRILERSDALFGKDTAA